MKPILKVIGGVAYFRLRKDMYDGKSIDEWSTRIRGLAKEAQEAYVYLRHDETGDNAGHAVRLKEKLLQKS